MDHDQFWTLVEAARASAESTNGVADEGAADLARELVARLAPLGTDAVLAYATNFDRATAALHRWDVWAAAYLIAGGCSDDSFMDFKAGIVALGREWHQRVVANPDSLADHPAVVQAATGGNPYVLFAESVNYVPAYAFEQITGDEEDYYEAASAATNPSDDASNDMGDNFDFDDPEQTARRLPRLTSMFRRAAAT